MTRFLYLLITITVGVSLFAQDKTGLVDFAQSLSHEEKRILDTGVALSYVSKKRQKSRLKYIPMGKQFDEIRDFVSKKKPTILYEQLFFIKTKNLVDTQKTMITISNYVRDIPIFASIKYKNIKKGYIYPVFLSSQEIVSLEEQVSTQTIFSLVTLPQNIEKNRIFVLQDMPPFGIVISQYIYRQDLQFTSFTGYNLTNISYRGIRSVKPKEMFITCYVIHTNRGVLVYAMGAVKVSGAATVFRKVISNSFQSRMVGLFNWVKNEYEGKKQL